ncbi:MAG TPA: DUF4395 family protein [Dehalococcoidia bacterium]|nr:DUF4395 family protein [Dehalococcoidia bacterium]
MLLDIQGFGEVDDATLARTQGWLRFAPALCALVAALGTALASPWTLWALAAIAAAGAALPFHPFDLAYRAGVRRFSAGPPLPENRAPRRFACALASGWLVVTGALFTGGYDVAGYVLGASLVAVATLVATTHVCIPSIIFRTACGQMPSLLRARV